MSAYDMRREIALAKRSQADPDNRDKLSDFMEAYRDNRAEPLPRQAQERIQMGQSTVEQERARYRR